MIILNRGIPLTLSREIKQAYIDLGFSLDRLRRTPFEDILDTLVDRGVAQWKDQINDINDAAKKATSKTAPTPNNANINVKQTDAHRSETLRQRHVSSPDDLTGTTGDKSQGRKHSTKSIKEKERLKRRAEAVHENTKSSVDISKDRAHINKNLKSKNATNRTVNSVRSTSKDHIKKNVNTDVTRKATKAGTSNREHLHRPIKASQAASKNSITKKAIRSKTKAIFQEGMSTGKNLWSRSLKTLKKFYSTPFGKNATKIGAAIIALNLLRGRLSSGMKDYNQNAIPEEYERGYDLINETLTDFGSPVKLQKTAAHVIMPYKSSIRRNNIKTTGSVIKSNIALRNHETAIRHTQY